MEKFYTSFTTYLYKNGCHDNYVGSQIKILKTVFNFLKNNEGLNVGQFYKNFYVRKEEVDILVLSQERLKFLIHDQEFEKTLTNKERIVKDMFIMGCTTGFRYSDLVSVTIKNFKKSEGKYYITNKSKKTKTETAVLLPSYAVDIYYTYKTKSTKNLLFGSMSLNKFNETLKDIGLKAGFTEVVEYKREQRGIEKKLVSARKQNLFCNKMSSHMMRRTAITTLLILGMPELLVRQISGHKYGSSSFMRYVKFAQAYLDKEIESVYSKLENYAPESVGSNR
ncbi:tyrosine-type recombinase/integrase [Nonlabens xylanidelens]|uniref:tyrosine-type recombinase/integrase n=1 Tax=Nonlabens xylanidelens TaxID=191564 RepID=UPI0011B040B8|nr:tyrosine-type recombinase/integrase [Nonlabens xylanidelens]